MEAETSKLSSSHDPLDYYNKLTSVLAKKKGLKINLKNIPGGLRKKEPKTISLLGAYLERRKRKADRIQVPKKRPPMNPFLEKDPPTKKKKKEEAWMKLPDSVIGTAKFDLAKFLPEPSKQKFKWQRPSTSHQHNTQKVKLSGSSLKPPEITHQSQQMQNKEQRTSQPSDDSLNFVSISQPRAKPKSFFTRKSQLRKIPDGSLADLRVSDVSMATVNSFTFKPREFSTPIEVQRPITDDPDNFFPTVARKLLPNPGEMLPATRSPEFNLAKAFKLADVVAEKILNSKPLADLTDPLTEIRGKIKDVYDERHQIARVINETLISNAPITMTERNLFDDMAELGLKQGKPVKMPTQRPQKLPVPTFADEDKKAHSPMNTEELFAIDPEQDNYKLREVRNRCIRHWLSNVQSPAAEDVDVDFEVSFVVAAETKKLFNSPEKTAKEYQESDFFQNVEEAFDVEPDEPNSTSFLFNDTFALSENSQLGASNHDSDLTLFDPFKLPEESTFKIRAENLGRSQRKLMKNKHDSDFNPTPIPSKLWIISEFSRDNLTRAWPF